MSNPDVPGQLDEIAVVGMTCRFPGAKNVDEFWRNLRDGVESISFFSDGELEAAGVNPALLNAPRYIKARPMLEDIESFDAAFFKINPREAEVMDPQHRLFLECAWEVLENAGCDPERYDGRIGVYAGAEMNSYLLHNIMPNRALLASLGGVQIETVSDKDYLTTRVSHKLNLTGPSIAIQTACSTSLVAVHLACESLLNNECDMALAGGVTVQVPHKTGYLYEEGGVASPDGHCRAFDAQAQGTIFGSGAGVVALKRLVDALADGDPIHAVIKGSAVNNDGAFKIGYTAPSVEGQARVVADALAVAGVEPETVSYLEAHGTGTPLGDPIEIAALTQVFRARTPKKGFCAIGSVKTNVGHLVTAAGVAGLIKTILALKHQLIPPSLNFKQPNPQIDFANSPFYVNTTLREWKTEGHPRRAGVSSFGIGGTNAHVVLEGAPEIKASEPSRRDQLLLLSARTEAALEKMTDHLAAHLQANPDLKLADVAYTLQVGRRAFERRRMVVCRTLADAVTVLQVRDPTRVLSGVRAEREKPVVFMFPGAGSQYAYMGVELYQTERVFREQVDKCVELLKPHLGFDVRTYLYPVREAREDAAQQMKRTLIGLPALFVTEYALAQLWISWGVRPTALIGHSLGEYTAACLAGTFSLKDALALVALRGRLFEQLPEGAMLSVSSPEKEIRPHLGKTLAIALIDTPSTCVVSGPPEAVAELEKLLAEKKVAFQRVEIHTAAHCEMVVPILKEFTRFVANCRLHAPRLPYVSNVTGTWITPAEATDPRYWARHLRQTVYFSDGMRELFQDPNRILLEVGPGQTLKTLARRHSDRPAAQVILTCMRRPGDRRSDEAVLLNSLGQLWLNGASVDWKAFYQGERRLHVSLPTYPFERERFWIEPAPGADAQAVSLVKNPNIADWFYIPSWKRAMPPAQEPEGVKGCWLLFSSDESLNVKLEQQLRAHGGKVVTVLAGDQFAANDDNVYVLRPAHRDDYPALFAALRERDFQPTHIVHLWNMLSLAENVADRAERELERSFYSLLFLAQALDEQNLDKLQLTVVSTNLHQVTGDEIVHPEKATLLGPCKVIPQEMPQIACRSIDIVLPEAGSSQEAYLVEQIVAELASSSEDATVAYRRYNRWVQTCEPAPLAQVEEPMNKLRKGGVYLITGGLGGIGLTLAGHLARTVQAKLVLTSRSHFPEAAAWEQWMAMHADEHRTVERIRAIQAMQAAGAEILVVQADVVERGQMEEAVRAACQRFGTLHGVIHAAGVPGGGTIQLKAANEAARVLSPKVRGTRVLEAVFQNISLDFIVLCSSNLAMLGGPGQVDYCAANAFLDAYAQTCAGWERPMTMSVNWDEWGEVGMAVNTRPSYPAKRDSRLEQRSEYVILPQEGAEAFQRILCRNRLPQIAVSTRHLPTLIQLAPKFTKARLMPQAAQVETLRAEHLRPNLQNAFVAPRSDVEEKLAAIWQQLLGIKQVGVHDNFFELGGDSLLASQVKSRVRDTFQVELPLRHFMDTPTVAELAQVIDAASQTESWAPAPTIMPDTSLTEVEL